MKLKSQAISYLDVPSFLFLVVSHFRLSHILPLAFYWRLMVSRSSGMTVVWRKRGKQNLRLSDYILRKHLNRLRSIYAHGFPCWGWALFVSSFLFKTIKRLLECCLQTAWQKLTNWDDWQITKWRNSSLGYFTDTGVSINILFHIMR